MTAESLFPEDLPSGTPSRPESVRTYAPEEILDEIHLSMVDEIGPVLTRRLMDRFGSAAAVLSAPQAQLEEVRGIRTKIARQLAGARELYDPRGLITLCQKESITILSKKDARYPLRLKEISDAPPILYVMGDLEPEDGLAVSIVGTRGMTLYGRQQAESLAGGLARAGFTVVSGLAMGIDGAAHSAALAAGGRTIAVLGSGLLRIFPNHHQDLAKRVAEHGALLSEFHPLMEPLAGNFPQRNRIVSGLSLGVVVVESPRKSGSLITARLAMEQNREVFAVPGPVDRENSRGCHRLLRDGAHLVESVDDIIENLGPLPLPVPAKKIADAPVRHPAEIRLNGREKEVLALLDTTPKPIDQVIAESGLAASQVLAVLSVLEAKRIARRESGNRVRRI